MGNPLNIYQRMAAITAELQTVAKNLDVSTGGGKSYKAVSERDVIDAVKPIETKHGVYSYPFDREVLESQTLEKVTEYNGKTTRSSTFFSRIRTVYRFVNIDEPSEYIDTVVFSEGIDPGDKGSGKAMTYGDKYALLKAYKISTGDDPDQTASEDVDYKPVRPTRESFKRAKAEAVCDDCGNAIERVTKRDGSVWEPEDIVAYSKRRFDRTLCPDCQRKAMKNNAD